MSGKSTIFTIGHSPFLAFSSFVVNLQSNGIDCVVDIRRLDGTTVADEFTEGKLRTELKRYGISYLTFYEEFAFIDMETVNSSGTPIYNKVIRSERFKKGIQRLEDGMSKGYTIALLGIPIIPNVCFRYTCIAPYLEDLGYNVMHILENGEAVLHNQMVGKQSVEDHVRQIKKRRTAELGNIGEEIAADYLMHNGYTILARNWNLHKGCELDIIAFKGNVLHAIEVKTRRNDKFASPEQAINNDKLRNINKALNQYCKEKHLLNLPTQIDSIAIVMRSETDYSLNMYENLVLRYSKRY